MAIALIGGAHPAPAATIWNQPTGGSWNSAANWNPATVPNATGANATFNDAASANNPAQAGYRRVTLDGTQTVGSLVFRNDAVNTFSNEITAGASGSLTFDEAGVGPAKISVPAVPGAGYNLISAAMTLTDSLVAQVDNTSASSPLGALVLTGAMGGTGGFTKQGDGLATFDSSSAKNYTGPTVISGGRLRISNAAQPYATSGFTINAGGQLDLTSAGEYKFGNGSLKLNGAGATSGQFAAFPGAIRNDTGISVTIKNALTLETDALLHVQATAGTGMSYLPQGYLLLTGTISGPGRLTFTAPHSNIDQGILILAAPNTYSGGTLVAGGIVDVSGSLANLGTGDVTVDNASSPESNARLQIDQGVRDAIADTATLTLAGGGVQGTPDQCVAILGSGVNEVVGGLVLGGIVQTTPGTYGSKESGATFQLNEFFIGPGEVTLVPLPEPASPFLLVLGGVTMCRRRKVSRA